MQFLLKIKTMQKHYLSIPLLSLLAVVGLFSCAKKSNNINNGQIIATPYSLYFADTSGAVFLTNDGKNISTVLPADGQPPLALVTSGENLVVVKSNIYVQVNNAINFNFGYGFAAQYQHLCVNGEVRPLNHTMIINSPSWAHMYVASQDPSPSNYFGIAWSTQNGINTSWVPETYYDTTQVGSSVPRNTMVFSRAVSTFTQLQGGVMVAMDTLHNVFFRNGPTIADRWRIHDADPAGVLNGGGYYFLGHLNNRLMAFDMRGMYGGYYSDDTGLNWTAISGLPANRPLLSVSSPYEQICLVGTDSAGVYVLNQGTGVFQPANSGLPAYSVVRGIAFKENIYKNDTKQQYIYLATNTGIYQSVDMGQNWVRTIPGNFVAIY